MANKELSKFDEMWKDACERFEEQTGRRPDGESTITLDECKKKIADAQSTDNDGANREGMKEYGMRALDYLTLLGVVVANGATMMFPPSSICFNAIAILLDIPKTLYKFWEMVDSLFETLWPSLSTFEIYHKIKKKEFDTIEVELKRVIHELLLNFVDICALSVNLRDSQRKRDKWAASAKRVLWNDDSGVEVAVKRFQGLTKAHESIQSTQILKTGLEAQSDIHNLKNSNDTRIATETRQSQLEKVRKKLGVDDQVKRSAGTGKQISEQRTPHTAAWFEDQKSHSEYTSWADSKNSEVKPILLVNGDKHTGKSVLLSAMTQSLHSAYKSPEKASSRAFVAKYFFPRSMRKEDGEKQPVESAMKCIAYLLAKQDQVYATNLHQALESKSDVHRYLKDATPIELWAFLLIGSPRNKSIHYMIIDGIEGLPEIFHEERQQFFHILALSHQSNQSTSRVAISVKSDTPIRSLKDLSWEIDIQKYNHEDIMTFIDSKLKEKDLFQEADEDSRGMRDTIRNTLTKEAKGSFAKVNAALDQINKVAEEDGQMSDIQQILEESNKDETAISERTVRQLQQSLTAEQINDVNELLIWVIYGYEYFGVNQLEAALFLRFRKRPILKLIKKLEGKYESLFKLDQYHLARVPNGILGSILKPRKDRREVNEAPKFTGHITITKGDLHSVQRFLWSLPQKFEHDSTRFRELVDQGNAKGDIGVDAYDAHLAIVRSTFRLLKEPPNKRTEAISRYLLRWLPTHLEVLYNASGINELTDAEKSEIGDGIYDMLFENGLEIHWKSCDYEDFWYGNAKKVVVFRRWLSDAKAISQLGRLDRQWLQAVENDSNPNQALLTRVMKRIAGRWLRCTEWDVSIPFTWLHQYFAMPKTPLNDPGNEQVEESTNSGTTPSEAVDVDIRHVASRCKQIIGGDTEDALWYQRLGETFQLHERYADGTDAFNKAIERGGMESSCYYGLAHCVAGGGKLPDACTLMGKALTAMAKDDQSDQSKIMDIYFNLAGWYGKLGTTDRAIHYTNSALQTVPEKGEVQFRALQIYLDIGQNHLATDLIRQLLGAGADQVRTLATLRNFLIQMLSLRHSNNWHKGVLCDHLFVRCFGVSRGDTSAFERLMGEMDGIIKSGEYEAYRAGLLLYKGVGLYFFGPESSRTTTARHEAQVAWKECLDTSGILGHTREHRDAAMLLSAHHFEQSYTSGDSDYHQQYHIEEIEKLAAQIGQFDMSGPRAHLAANSLRKEGQTAARKVLQASMKTTFDLLSDDIEENGGYAYYLLGCILTHLGDDINARIAFFFRLPNPANVDVMEKLLSFEKDDTRAVGAELLKDLRSECEVWQPVDKQITMALKILAKRESELSSKEDGFNHGPQQEYATIRDALQEWSGQRYLASELYCDGCLRSWGFDFGVHQCSCCYDTCFCDDCVADVDNGQIKKLTVSGLACKPTHKRLYLPKLDRDGLLMGFGGRVKMGDGVVVPASEWLDGLKREWGYGGADGKASSVDDGTDSSAA
ncbi:hypothetical protein PG987_007564 [Apiospora arundinis]